jgi:fructose-1,6-bisphosphatase I
MYSFSTELVITFGNGVKRFTLDSEVKEFHLSDNFVSIPSAPYHFYSINEGNIAAMDHHMQNFIYSLKHSKEEPYSLRYIGSMIGDVHRTITYGGIYLYPIDKKRPHGKLRLLYECAPLAMIVEQAGGEVTTGMYKGEITRLLDIDPKRIHETCPIIVACTRDMTKLRESYNEGYLSVVSAYVSVVCTVVVFRCCMRCLKKLN